MAAPGPHLFACTLAAPGAATPAALEAWAAHVRACAAAAGVPPERAHLCAALHEGAAATLAAAAAAAGIGTLVTVPDGMPFEAPGPALAAAASAGAHLLSDDALRRCFACPALMRVRLLAHVAGAPGGGGALVWFLGLAAADMGTPAQFARAFAGAEAAGGPGACIVLPQPDAQGERAVLVDLPPRGRAAAPMAAILPCELARAALRLPAGGLGPIRAPAAQGLDWALAPLATFASCPFRVGQVPVTIAWVRAGGGGATARAARGGEDHAWFWAAAEKGVRVRAIFPAVPRMD